jgi:hypothetical protein
MLFIKHFDTIIFAFLVFGSMVLGMPVPTRGKPVDPVEEGKIYQAPLNHTNPKAGNQVHVLSVILENRY